VTDGLRVALTLEQCWHAVPGGTARSALDSARALQQLGTLELVGVAARHAAPPPDDWKPSIPVHMLGLPRRVLYESWHYLRAPKIDGATGKVDLIHATGGAIPPRSAPLVVTVHDLAFLHDRSHFTRHGIRFFERALELTRRDADLVVAPSEATLDDCVAHGIERDRLRLVPWGVDTTRATPSEIDEARARHGLDGPYVMWTGTVEPRKNLATLLRAFAKADTDARLVLVGPKGWKEDLDTLIAGVRERVQVLGFVPHDQLPALYAGASVFCYPSIREGFGLPVLEAMAQGTPVITSTGTSTAEVGGDAAVLVDPMDVDAIAAALEHLLGERARARELGEAGARRAAGYTWSRTAQLLAAVYQEVAA
jgi:glycosyltransferase involved in cell wall biosynthesis